MRGRWLVLHFDHRLRGAASSADARFVARLARGLGERCVVGRWVRGRSPAGTPAGPASEAAAREARFAFFTRAMRDGGARVLVLGHHADDVVETMLMRLARGSGTGGLAAPRPVHRRHDGSVRVRPLLTLEAAEVRAALRAARAPWREDTSNATDTHLRNRMRRRVVPALRAAVGRPLTAGWLAARQALEDDDVALELWLRECAGSGASLAWAALSGKPRALVRRAVQAWLQAQGLSMHVGRPSADALIEAVAAGRRARLSAGPDRFVVFDLRRMSIESTRQPQKGWGTGLDLAVGATLVGPDGAALSAQRLKLTARLARAIRHGDFSPAQTVFLASDAAGFRVRRRRAGDRYRPLGAPGRGRLQDLLINRKIPRDQRDRLPVVCDDQDEPIWVPGLPPAHELAVSRGTKLVVQLTYTQPGAIVRSP